MSEDGELLNRARTFEKIVDIENYEWNHTEKGLGELRQRILNSRFVSVKVLDEAKADFPTKYLDISYNPNAWAFQQWFKKWFGEP